MQIQKIVHLFAVMAFVSMLPSSTKGQAVAERDSSYKLVWSDEFTYAGRPDSSKWDYEVGFIRNNEPQWYQPDNAWVDGENLVITVKKERKANPNYDPASSDWRLNRAFAEYTSACLITLGKFEFTYGRVEMRAKIDTRKGMWPAFWMLGKNRGPVKWPNCGEVDIMEFFRGDLLGNWFWNGEDGAVVHDIKIPVKQRWGETWGDIFHTWVLEWDEQHMRITVDGEEVNGIDLARTLNYPDNDNPYHKPFYLLVNIALGQAGEEIPDENLPAQLLVDYVRVYQ